MLVFNIAENKFYVTKFLMTFKQPVFRISEHLTNQLSEADSDTTLEL